MGVGEGVAIKRCMGNSFVDLMPERVRYFYSIKFWSK